MSLPTQACSEATGTSNQDNHWCFPRPGGKVQIEPLFEVLTLLWANPDVLAQGSRGLPLHCKQVPCLFALPVVVSHSCLTWQAVAGAANKQGTCSQGMEMSTSKGVSTVSPSWMGLAIVSVVYMYTYGACQNADRQSSIPAADVLASNSCQDIAE